MNIVFFGSSHYCLPVLGALKKDLVFVVTRPDKPMGRKHLLTPSPVKVWAEKNGIPVFFLKTPVGGGVAEFRSQSGKAAPTNVGARAADGEKFGEPTPKSSLDLAIVADFGQILPKEIFTLPRLGTFNIHFSKLPDLRGPSPVQSAILRGDTTAWVTIFKIEETLDTGPILDQREFPILPDDTAGTLYTRLFEEVAKYLPCCIKNYVLSIMQNKNILIPQDHARATYCQKLTKQNGFIDWGIIHNTKYIIQNYNQYRALTPWPGLWTYKEEAPLAKNPKLRMKILKCHLEENKLVLDEIQFEGKKPQKFFDKLLL